jgi:hypothetical protein
VQILKIVNFIPLKTSAFGCRLAGVCAKREHFDTRLKAIAYDKRRN